MRMMTLAARQGGDVTTARVAASPGRTEGGRGAAALPLGWLAEDVERRAVAKRRDAFGRYPVPVVDEALGGGDPLEDRQVGRRARQVAADDQDSLVAVGVGDLQDRQ